MYVVCPLAAPLIFTLPFSFCFRRCRNNRNQFPSRSTNPQPAPHPRRIRDVNVDGACCSAMCQHFVANAFSTTLVLGEKHVDGRRVTVFRKRLWIRCGPLCLHGSRQATVHTEGSPDVGIVDMLALRSSVVDLISLIRRLSSAANSRVTSSRRLVNSA
jgi:hypothetical protein